MVDLKIPKFAKTVGAVGRQNGNPTSSRCLDIDSNITRRYSLCVPCPCIIECFTLTR